MVRASAAQVSPAISKVVGTPVSATILVVDDDAAIRAVVTMALEEEGYRVLAAEHGQAALDRLNAEVADLVLLDMQMPVMDGPTFCQRLASQQLRDRTTVVVMTASNRTQQFRELCGADDALGKPFQLEDLYAVVERYVRPGD